MHLVRSDDSQPTPKFVFSYSPLFSLVIFAWAWQNPAQLSFLTCERPKLSAHLSLRYFLTV